QQAMRANQQKSNEGFKVCQQAEQLMQQVMSPYSVQQQSGQQSGSQQVDQQQVGQQSGSQQVGQQSFASQLGSNTQSVNQSTEQETKETSDDRVDEIYAKTQALLDEDESDLVKDDKILLNNMADQTY